MFDRLYSEMARKVNYKVLFFVPIAITLLLLPIFFNTLLPFSKTIPSVPLSIQFQGGAEVEVIPNQTIEENVLRKELESNGWENVEMTFSTKSKSVVIRTSTMPKEKEAQDKFEKEAKDIFSKYLSELRDNDIALVKLNQNPSFDEMDQLKAEWGNVLFNESTSTLQIITNNINQEKLNRTLNNYFPQHEKVEIKERNFYFFPLTPNLAQALRSDGIIFSLIGYALMAIVVFVAFRELIPSLAVIMAATLDILIAVGGMGLLGIKMQPVTLLALLMLIGYSVDSDILLTSRVLKRRRGEVNERIDDAMKTGLTMTITTLTAMVVMFISATYFGMEVLSAIASVMIVGLIGDIFTTWFMNAGMLKWYREEKGGKLNLSFW